MHLRAFREGDFEALLTLTIEVFGPFIEESFRPAVGDRIWLTQHRDWRGDYRTQLTGLHDPDQHKHVTVAADDGRIVGFVAWANDPVKRGGTIEFVAVAPAARRDHVGTALCEHAFAAMREAGMDAVMLGTGGDWFHAPARALYESVGMTAWPIVLYVREL